MTLKNILSEDRRGCILRLLTDQPDYALNHAMLTTALSAIGHGVSRDVVKADIAWLAEMHLVEMEDLEGCMVLAKITVRGVDVAKGVAIVPGITRPDPS